MTTLEEVFDEDSNFWKCGYDYESELPKNGYVCTHDEKIACNHRLDIIKQLIKKHLGI